MTLVLVAGTTATAAVDGLTAAGAAPDLAAHTPAADLEIVTYGRPVRAPVVPVSPAGCPTPAVVTRAVRELVGVPLVAVDAGLAGGTAAPTLDLGFGPGGDVREPVALPDAEARFAAARDVGRRLGDDELLIGESVPGGTTTALGVLRALGEPHGVSSSLAENPLDLKRDVVEAGLEASGLPPGEAAGEPVRALEAMGDPVLAAVAGLVTGAVGTGGSVTLAGGTQLVAVAALLRHAGVGDPLRLATTSFVAEDDTADIRAAAAGLDLDLHVTAPGFDRGDHVAFERYRRGEGKEGVGMGGALHLAERAGTSMAEIRDRTVEVYGALCPERGRERRAGADRGP